MMTRIRVGLLVLRPAAAILLVLSASIGLSRAAATTDPVAAVLTATLIGCLLLFSIAVNDLADIEIDRINLAQDAGRLLARSAVSRRQTITFAVLSATIALTVSAVVSPLLLIVTGSGLVVSSAYSLPPIRLAARGMLAPLTLPICYAAVPYLTAFAAAHRTPTVPDLVQLAGLYLGFTGRLLLKDFRDLRGDALYGKRTVLVRHGRALTCHLSIAGWLLGALLLALAAPAGSLAYDTALLVEATAVVAITFQLRNPTDLRRQERLISAAAILGRATLVTVLLHDEATRLATPPRQLAILFACLVTVSLGQAVCMLRYGPAHRRSAPACDGGTDLVQAGSSTRPAPGARS